MFDLPTSLLLVLAVFAGMMAVLVVGFGVLSAFPEAADRFAHWLFDR